MFTVIWQSIALDEMADAMVVSDLTRQDLIERQVLDLNNRLAADPRSMGESRLGDYRVVFAEPVAILYHVSDADSIVRVVHFWTF
jgi:hypothetical protein